MFVMVIIATIVISANGETEHIKLPLCLNDEQFMGERPQPLWANLLLVGTVLITMFLANNVVLTKIFGAVCGPTISWCSMVSLRLGVACGAAVVEMSLVILKTRSRQVFETFISRQGSLSEEFPNQ